MDEVDGMAGNEDRGGIPVSSLNIVVTRTLYDNDMMLLCRS